MFLLQASISPPAVVSDDDNYDDDTVEDDTSIAPVKVSSSGFVQGRTWVVMWHNGSAVASHSEGRGFEPCSARIFLCV